ncbi:long-chain fatty acid transport protein [Paucimonas lemoignei]|uniref:Long-chain fatty acid transport protein n=1 Tax=Paucimonas lemoignei TaxID=29443 RepID=A0A4R3HT45_PAULE|nr:outer membrane protein transport protein [Paucimonas lemoignei]TCS36202.1 long-chain fatty acid transport protein [Paucimonas lemoignei]
MQIGVIPLLAKEITVPNRFGFSLKKKLTELGSSRVLPMVSLVGLLGMASAGMAHASGFALNEMSAATLGNAHAGAGAAAEDLSTIYFNPAGLTRMSGSQIQITASGIRPSAKFTNAGSNLGGATPLTGGNGGDAGGWALVPAMFYAMDLAPNLRFGIGVQSPFGLKTEYDANWAGRYQALTSDMKTVNINPSLAYKLNDMVSLGAGVSFQYIDVELSQAIDFGAACFNGPAIAGLGPANCAASGFIPQTRDGKATIKGHDWGYGFNLGALFTPTENSRFGIAYRSHIKHTLKGDASYDRPAGLPAALAASNRFANGGANADVTLPESLSVSGYVDLDSKWALLGDVSWVRWSRFKELRVRFDNGAPESVTSEEWRNTVRVAIGANYRYNDAWKLRGGIAYDPSPVKDEFRTPRVPDADRTWLSFGAQYKPSANDTWDFGYAHLFVKDASINKTEASNGTTVRGNYESNVNIVSVQYSRKF